MSPFSVSESVSESDSWQHIALISIYWNKFFFFKFLTAPHGMWDLSSPNRDQTCAPCIGRQSFNHWTAREVSNTLHWIITLLSSPLLWGSLSMIFRTLRFLKSNTKSPWSCPTLCNPMECSLPGSSVHGILQDSPLEWVAVPSSRRSSQSRDRTCVSYLYLHWQAGSSPLAPVPVGYFIEYPSFEFVWYFLGIRLGLRVWGKSTPEVKHSSYHTTPEGTL